MLSLKASVPALVCLALLGGSLALADEGVPDDAPPLFAPDGPFLGVLPKPDAGAPGEDDTPSLWQTARPLLYHGGSVMRSNTVRAVYWLPPGSSVSSGYVALVDRYLADVARDSRTHTNVYGTGTQYYEKTSSGNARYITYAVRQAPPSSTRHRSRRGSAPTPRRTSALSTRS
jgi:hypothetical protein